jgi:dUTPase
MFKIVNGGTYPTRGSKYSAYVDVYANEDVVVGAGETKVVNLGIQIDLDFIKGLSIEDTEINMESFFDSYPEYTREFDELKHIEFMSTHYLQLALRSSLGKKGLILPNGIGIIDLDYSGSIGMIIHNPLKLLTESANGCTLVYPEVHKQSKYYIKKGDRIGQITLLEHKSNLFNIGSDVVRFGGFGSTGE